MMCRFLEKAPPPNQYRQLDVEQTFNANGEEASYVVDELKAQEEELKQTVRTYVKNLTDTQFSISTLGKTKPRIIDMTSTDFDNRKAALIHARRGDAASTHRRARGVRSNSKQDESQHLFLDFKSGQ